MESLEGEYSSSIEDLMARALSGRASLDGTRRLISVIAFEFGN